jgi:glyoxylase-like metal-dependent hydrolase (beta-lactamase superfamily II)
MALKHRIGKLELICLSDGLLSSSVDYVLGMKSDEANDIAGATQCGKIDIPVNVFYFERDGARILIDAGSGSQMQAGLGRLPESLRTAGIAPESITHVLLTHLHPDHSDGLIDNASEPIFPKATIVLHEDEYNFWMGPASEPETAHLKKRRAQNRKDIAPYRARLMLVRDGDVFLGCSPLLSPGHTPGHTCWRIETGAEDLIAVGDTVHFAAIQFASPRTSVKYDLDPDLARASRLKILDWVASHKLTIAGAHITAPGLGTVLVRDGGYQFLPVETHGTQES